MAQNMVAIHPEAKIVLRKLAKRKRVSQQGLLSALIFLANGDFEDMGIIDLEWSEIQRRYPNLRRRRKTQWQKVVEAVKVLNQEGCSAEEMAMRSRYTLAQINRALKEIDS